MRTMEEIEDLVAKEKKRVKDAAASLFDGGSGKKHITTVVLDTGSMLTPQASVASPALKRSSSRALLGDSQKKDTKRGDSDLTVGGCGDLVGFGNPALDKINIDYCYILWGFSQKPAIAGVGALGCWL